MPTDRYIAAARTVKRWKQNTIFIPQSVEWLKRYNEIGFERLYDFHLMNNECILYYDSLSREMKGAKHYKCLMRRGI